MSPVSPLFRTMPFDEKVVRAVRSLIGDPVVLHLDQVFLKPARHGVGTSWHQDNAYFRIDDPLLGTAMWIAVHDATLANGTLHLVPDCFAEPLEHARDAYSDHHIRCWPPEERAVAVELPAGGAVFFAYGTPHCTKANETDRERAGVALHFLNGSAVGPGYFGADGPMKHPALSGPRADGGRGAYGADLRGVWEREVDRALRDYRASR